MRNICRWRAAGRHDEKGGAKQALRGDRPRHQNQGGALSLQQGERAMYTHITAGSAEE